MTSTKSPKAPRLPKQRDPWPIQSVALQSFEEYEALTLDGVDLSTQQAAHLTWRGVQCKTVRLDETQFDGLRLIDVHFAGCNLANAQWSALTAERILFNECQLIGFDAPDARLHDIIFSGCQAQFAKLRFSKFKGARFERCDLRNADFQGSDLSGVVFYKCDLTDAQLSGTTLKGTDFRGSTIERMRVGIAELPGAIVEPIQAAYIAGVLGIVVKLEGEE